MNNNLKKFSTKRKILTFRFPHVGSPTGALQGEFTVFKIQKAANPRYNIY